MIPRNYRKKRQVVFVCSAILNDNLISEIVERETSEDAINTFKLKHKQDPSSILGPFYKKRTGILDSHVDIKFAGKTYSGQYDAGHAGVWNVKAMELTSPPQAAWILFESRADGKPAENKPVSSIVLLSDVKINP